MHETSRTTMFDASMLYIIHACSATHTSQYPEETTLSKRTKPTRGVTVEATAWLHFLHTSLAIKATVLHVTSNMSVVVSSFFQTRKHMHQSIIQYRESGRSVDIQALVLHMVEYPVSKCYWGCIWILPQQKEHNLHMARNIWAADTLPSVDHRLGIYCHQRALRISPGADWTAYLNICRKGNLPTRGEHRTCWTSAPSLCIWMSWFAIYLWA